MGRASVFVFLIVVLVTCYGVAKLIQTLVRDARERHTAMLLRTTPWRQYLDVGERGEFIIGVQREAEGRTFAKLEMARYPAEHDALDIKLKINEAMDRATIYNNERDQQ